MAVDRHRRVGRKDEIVIRSPQPVERAIAAVAARQHGNITRQQLRAIGLNKNAIAYRVRIGRLYRVHSGVYSVGKPSVTPLERAAAAVLACGPGAVLSHSSAMTLWGFWRRWDSPLEVTVALDRRPRGIKVHRIRTLAWREVSTHLGIRVTSPARTLLDCAPSLSEQALKRAVNDALHSRWLRDSQLAELLERLPHLPGAGRLARLIGVTASPTRSDWEDGFPAFCERYGLPRPVMGAKLLGYTVDALFPAEKVIVELDSWLFHSGRIAFENDRERDADTLAAGHVTVRMTWARTERAPRKEAARLHAILRARRSKAA